MSDNQNASEFPTINTIKVKKGNVAKVPFNAWDYVRNCIGEKCSISHMCDYPRDCKCGIEKAYLTAVLQPYNELLIEAADPVLNQWLGIHLIPLYHDLIRIKMAKLQYDSVVLSGPMGRITVNPLLQELRLQITAIRRELRESGIQRLLISRGHIGGGAVDNDLKSYLDGAQGFYEEMSRGKDADE